MMAHKFECKSTVSFVFIITIFLSMNSIGLLKRLKFTQFLGKNKYFLSTNNCLSKSKFLSTKKSINFRKISNSCHSLPSIQPKEIIVPKMSSEHIFTNDTPGKSQIALNIPIFSTFRIAFNTILDIPSII